MSDSIQSYNPNQRFILAVDDDVIILNVLINHLHRFLPQGIEVVAVDNPEDALKEATKIIQSGSEIIVVISDYLMFPMKGSEMLIKMSQIAPSARKIMLTGQADVKAVAEVINNVKLFRFIEKPWYPKDLELTILEAIHAFENEKRLLQQEQELRAFNEELQRKVEERTAELAHKNREILQSLEYARVIQDAFVPSLELLKPAVKNCYLFESPLGIISGDFYWVYKSEKYAFVLQGDCTGHGLAGALLSVLVMDIAKTFILTIGDDLNVVTTTKEIIHELRNKVAQDKWEVLESVGVDFCLLKLEIETSLCHYANFNSNIAIKDQDKIEMISKSKGFFRMLQYESDIENGVLNLKNKRILLFSDGVTDMMGGPLGKRLRWPGLQTWLSEPQFFEKGPTYLKQKVDNYTHNMGQTDDMIILSFEC